MEGGCAGLGACLPPAHLRTLHEMRCEGGVLIADDEEERLRVLRDLRVLDSDFDPRFDRITGVAARLLGVPMALVSLVDLERQWFKSKVGLDPRETSRSVSFCNHAIQPAAPDVFVVLDAEKDARFADNALVTGPPHLRFYAGAPLIVDGYKVGTLCVLDVAPHARFSLQDKANLLDLAGLVVDELLMLRWSRDRVRRDRHRFLACAAHDFKTPVTAFQLGVELLHESPLTAAQRAVVDHLASSTHMLAATLERALSMASARDDDDGAGAPWPLERTLRPERVSVQELVRRVASLTELYPKRVPLQFMLHLDAPREVLSDATILWRCMVNYIINALQATREGAVRCTLMPAVLDDCRGGLRVEVLDTGPGVAPHALRSLFQEPAAAGTSGAGGGELGGGGGGGGGRLGLGLFSVGIALDALRGHYGGGNRTDGRSGALFWLEVPPHGRARAPAAEGATVVEGSVRTGSGLGDEGAVGGWGRAQAVAAEEAAEEAQYLAQRLESRGLHWDDEEAGEDEEGGGADGWETTGQRRGGEAGRDPGVVAADSPAPPLDRAQSELISQSQGGARSARAPMVQRVVDTEDDERLELARTVLPGALDTRAEAAVAGSDARAERGSGPAASSGPGPAGAKSRRHAAPAPPREALIADPSLAGRSSMQPEPYAQTVAVAVDRDRAMLVAGSISDGDSERDGGDDRLDSLPTCVVSDGVPRAMPAVAEARDAHVVDDASYAGSDLTLVHAQRAYAQAMGLLQASGRGGGGGAGRASSGVMELDTATDAGTLSVVGTGGGGGGGGGAYAPGPGCSTPAPAPAGVAARGAERAVAATAGAAPSLPRPSVEAAVPAAALGLRADQPASESGDVATRASGSTRVLASSARTVSDGAGAAAGTDSPVSEPDGGVVGSTRSLPPPASSPAAVERPAIEAAQQSAAARRQRRRGSADGSGRTEVARGHAISRVGSALAGAARGLARIGRAALPRGAPPEAVASGAVLSTTRGASVAGDYALRADGDAPHTDAGAAATFGATNGLHGPVAATAPLRSPPRPPSTEVDLGQRPSAGRAEAGEAAAIDESEGGEGGGTGLAGAAAVSAEALLPGRALVRALVVDDSAVARQALRRALTLLGCDVSEAQHGAAGLARMQHRPFDLVLVDFLMPVLNGVQCAAAYRAWEAKAEGRRACRAFIVGMSATADAQDVHAGLEAGMDAFFAKPLSPLQLRQVVQQIAEAKR